MQDTRCEEHKEYMAVSIPTGPAAVMRESNDVSAYKMTSRGQRPLAKLMPVFPADIESVAVPSTMYGNKKDRKTKQEKKNRLAH